MQRRDLLLHLAFGLGGFAAGGGLVAGLHRYRELAAPACIVLPESLAALADGRFREALPEAGTDALLARLEAAGVFSQGCFDLGKLAQDAESHPLVEFGGFQYTEPELALYALIARFPRP